jgi:hypothetical protein
MATTYIENLRRTVMHNASAYGYSILITAAFAVLSSARGSPSTGEVFLAITGASGAFVCVEMAATRFFRDRRLTDSPEATLLGSATHFFAIGAGTGAAALVGWRLPGTFAWIAGPFLATVSYLIVEAIELTGASRKEERS